MNIHSTAEEARDLASGLVLARPDRAFLASYIDALTEGMEACRHKIQKDEIDNLQSGCEYTWKMFSEKCSNSVGTDNFCMEDMFWLTKQDLFIGYVMLRTEMGPMRAKYGGNTGRVFRPSQRGKGYGTIGLEMTKSLAQKRGYTELIMVTDAGNIAARRPWEKCGGVIIDEITEVPKNYSLGRAVKYRIPLERGVV